MVKLSPDEAAQLRRQLQAAISDCSERCLYQSAKWTAELLSSLDDGYQPRNAPTNAPATFPDNHDTAEARLERQDLHKFLLAQTFFKNGEFDRCAAVFLKDIHLPTSSMPQISEKSLFLSLYAKYIAGEKRKLEDSAVILGPADNDATQNRELAEVAAILEAWFAEREAKNIAGSGWLEYLYGVVLANNKLDDLARSWLVKSLNLYPFNWAAWQELASLIGTTDEFTSALKVIPEHNVMATMFFIYVNVDFGQVTPQVEDVLSRMITIFTGSAFLLTQAALLQWHNFERWKCPITFSHLLRTHPYCLDAMEQYARVLWRLERTEELANLARQAYNIDKSCRETYCILGHYYSTHLEDEKSVTYFRRAIALDRKFARAWHYMGAAYVVLDNPRAALASFLRAVALNRRDCQSWFCAGEMYKTLGNADFALPCYQKAVELRPLAAWRWHSLGECYATKGDWNNVIRCYRKAICLARDDEEFTEEQRSSMMTDFVNRLSDVHFDRDEQDLGIECLERCGEED